MGSIKKCENVKCKNIHDGTFGSGRFCSKACANSRNWDKNHKIKLSKSAKSSKKVIEANRNRPKQLCILSCVYCKNEFEVYSYNLDRKYCSRKCFNSDPNAYKNKGLGGYRRGSGRGKSGWYKGYWCDSTYELVWIIYNLDNGISFNRNNKKFPYTWNGKVKYYYPDFEINNQLIEIKGYSNSEIKAKLKSVPELKVLYKNDLKKHFDWVKNNYKYNNIWELYDNYKPEFTYRCNHCERQFNSKYKRKTKKVFCSRECIGKSLKYLSNK